MPEFRESWLAVMYLRWAMEQYEDMDWSVRDVWYDAVGSGKSKSKKPKKPKNRPLPGTPHAQGLVDRLTPQSPEAKRGTQGIQTPLWPTMWDRTRPDCPTMQSLQLKGAYETARTAVLDLGPLWMQVGWLLYLIESPITLAQCLLQLIVASMADTHVYSSLSHRILDPIYQALYC